MKHTVLVKKRPAPPTKPKLPPPPWPPPDGFQRHPRVRYGYVWWPPVDIEDTDEKYVFTADLSGTEPGAVDIELMGNEIMVSGTDRAAGFAFAITLPESVDADDLEAAFENGVLVLTVPKSASTRHHKVQLKD